MDSERLLKKGPGGCSYGRQPQMDLLERFS
jgi:hypothetical protein